MGCWSPLLTRDLGAFLHELFDQVVVSTQQIILGSTGFERLRLLWPSGSRPVKYNIVVAELDLPRDLNLQNISRLYNLNITSDKHHVHISNA